MSAVMNTLSAPTPIVKGKKRPRAKKKPPSPRARGRRGRLGNHGKPENLICKALGLIRAVDLPVPALADFALAPEEPGRGWLNKPPRRRRAAPRGCGQAAALSQAAASIDASMMAEECE